MSIIKVQDIAFVRFRAPDLAEMRRFLEEFGLTCFDFDGKLYARSADGSPFSHVTEEGEPGFLGLGLRARSQDDLRVLSEQTGAAVQTADTPGGGGVVRLCDPDGNAVEVVTEQSWQAAAEVGDDLPINTIRARRRLRAPVRLEARPSHVRRLGHAMLMVRDFEASRAWYERLGFLTSDVVEAEAGKPFGAFLRCDLGQTPTDHHTIALVQTPDGPGFGHAAFEVSGLDDLMLGHTYLKARKRPHAWGVGRHKLGSQIFDYWRDPWGHELEHWTDGDLFTADDAPGVATLEDLLGSQWGSAHPILTAER